jgi:hypothetical protein
MSTSDAASYAALCFIWLLFTAWTIASLSAAAQRPDSRITRIGIKGFGLSVWVLVTVIASRYIFQAAVNAPLWRVLGVAYFMLPICLWAGYFWGRLMQAYMTARRG